MEILYFLIPVSVLLVFAIALAFWWSVRSGQFDDLEGPGFRILMDDDRAPAKPAGKDGRLDPDQPPAVRGSDNSASGSQ